MSEYIDLFNHFSNTTNTTNNMNTTTTTNGKTGNGHNYSILGDVEEIVTVRSCDIKCKYFNENNASTSKIAII
jgi:hypothetical protein